MENLLPLIATAITLWICYDASRDRTKEETMAARKSMIWGLAITFVVVNCIAGYFILFRRDYDGFHSFSEFLKISWMTLCFLWGIPYLVGKRLG